MRQLYESVEPILDQFYEFIISLMNPIQIQLRDVIMGELLCLAISPQLKV